VTNILGLAKFKKPDIRAITLEKEIPKLCQQWKHSSDHDSDISIQYSIAHDLPPLYVDFQQLRQVLLNLILNSEEALENDGIIILSVWQENDFAVFQLQDDGPGIAEEHIDELFKNFFTTKTDGLGLGLAVCKQIISAHHGFITIGNLPENGVEVLIYLPFRPAEMVVQEDVYSGEMV
jgi:signal transduction histidine kinase